LFYAVTVIECNAAWNRAGADAAYRRLYNTDRFCLCLWQHCTNWTRVSFHFV